MNFKLSFKLFNKLFKFIIKFLFTFNKVNLLFQVSSYLQTDINIYGGKGLLSIDIILFIYLSIKYILTLEF